MGGDWRQHYSVDIINGRQGYSLKLDGSKLIVNTLRVGFEKRRILACLRFAP